VIGLAFYLAKRMIGVFPALVGFLLISFDPWYLALSRISHTDAPQATFQFISVLAFVSFLYIRRESILLLLSGFLGGIALLSKLPALISGLVFAFLALLKYFQDIALDKPKRAFEYFSASRKYVKILAIWILIFLFAIALFFPFVWEQPVEQLRHMVIVPAYQVSKLYPSLGVTHYPATEDSVRFSLDYYTRYPLAFLWHTTPVILLGLLASVAAYRLKTRVFEDQNVRKLVGGLFWFIVIYTVVITIPPKWSPRYYLPVHLCMDLIAGIGLVNLCLELSSRLKIYREKLFSYGLVVILMVVQLAGVLPTFPYYFSYYNPLLGGSKKAGETTFVGHGEGLGEAAEYLNAKPGAEDLTVMSWYGIGPFSFFFQGETVDLYFSRGFSVEETSRFFEEIDYLVTYSNQWFRHIPKKLFDILDGVDPEYSVWINEIEYARIYDVSALEESLID
jgi:hypothetical protein